MRHSRLGLVILSVLVTSMIFSSSVLGCESTGLSRYPDPDLTVYLNQWGMLMMAARNPEPGCAEDAREKAGTYIAFTPVSFWQQPNAGYYVTLAMATGLEIGGRDLMTPLLDQHLYDVGQQFQPVIGFGGTCGWVNGNWQNGNTCMDDYVGIASAYGWITAYYRFSGRYWDRMNGAANNYLHFALHTYDSICISNPSEPLDPYFGICNGQVSNLGNPETPGYSIISLNHGNQAPPYGIGMMTSFAAATLGLEVAQMRIWGWTQFSADERKIAEYLFREGQATTQQYNTLPDFLSSGCYSVSNPGTSVPCWDYGQFGNGGNHYRAWFFPVQLFYQHFGFTAGDPDPALYHFNNWEDVDNVFVINASALNTQWGAGRKETYKTLARDWFISRPNLTAGHEYLMAVQTAPYVYVYMRASNCGGPGSVVDATATDYNAPEARMTLVDLNGGLLLSGDPVALRTCSGYYISAEGGGGGQVSADRTSVAQWETFTIRKTAGSPGSIIAEPDQFTLQTYYGYYISAVNDGGSGVNATPRTVGPNETWLFAKNH